MKKTICLWALLLIVVSCTNDDNYNDEHGDKAVIPPKGRIIRIMTYNIYGARATSPANAADLDALAEDGLLTPEEYQTIDWESTPDRVNYGALYRKKGLIGEEKDRS